MAEPEEWHITSLVVHALPSHVEALSRWCGTLPGAQLHAALAEQGKLVLTLEGPNAEAVMSSIGRLQRANGVLSAAIVFQCAEPLAAMNEEMPDADAAT